jgi:hypothetical protein
MLYNIVTTFVKKTEETRGTPKLTRQLKSKITPFHTTKVWISGIVGPCILKMYSGFMDGQLHVPTAASLAKGARFTMNRKLRET